MHIFAGGYAADGAFVHFQSFGHIAQQHGFEVFDPFFEKVPLAFDDFFGDAQNCRCALVQSFDKKIGGADAVFEIALGFFVLAAEVTDFAVIFPVYQYLGQGKGVQLNQIFAVFVGFDKDIRDNI